MQSSILAVNTSVISLTLVGFCHGFLGTSRELGNVCGESSWGNEKSRASCEVFQRDASSVRKLECGEGTTSTTQTHFLRGVWVTSVHSWDCARLLCGAIRISVRSSEELSSGTCSWLIAAEWCQHGHWLKCKSWRSVKTHSEGSRGGNYRNTDGLQKAKLCLSSDQNWSIPKSLYYVSAFNHILTLSAQAAMEKEMIPCSTFCENCLKGKAQYNGYSFWDELWLTKDLSF